MGSGQKKSRGRKKGKRIGGKKRLREKRVGRGNTLHSTLYPHPLLSSGSLLDLEVPPESGSSKAQDSPLQRPGLLESALLHAATTRQSGTSECEKDVQVHTKQDMELTFMSSIFWKVSVLQSERSLM